MALAIREVFNWYARLWPKKFPKPPYRHIVQLGDPILRKKTLPVPKPAIATHNIAKTADMLKFVMRKYGSVGLSAPQIGIPERIFAMELNEKHKRESDQLFAAHEMVLLPFTVFINPQITFVGSRKVTLYESCESFKGFTAHVPRYHEVKINAFDLNAKEFSINLKGWLARIAQHEMDHLDGKIFIDIMLKDTLHCTCWEEVNQYEGKITLPFAP